MALISTDSLTKTYSVGQQTVAALRGVSMEMAEGEFLAVMGPSGSGKSTFMNLVGCLDRPTSGRYRLAGEDVADLSPDALATTRNRRIGFVFQNFNLLARVPAAENVELPLLYAGVPAAERRARARAGLASVGLEDRADHQPTQLSGGQQQRVAIARALINNPSLVLADEPTGALDSATSLEVMALFQRLHSRGLSIIIVTHEREVAEFAQRIVTFRDGRIVEDRINPHPRRADA